MAEQVLKHFRFGGKLSHIGIEALTNGKDINVTIENIRFVESEVINGSKQDAWICKFKQNPHFTLPMVLNATNRKRLAKLSGTPFLETVTGLVVTLTQEMSKMVDGGKDFALRVSNIKPSQVVAKQAEKPRLTLESENLQQIKDWLAGDGTVTGVEKKYDVSPDCLIELNKVKEQTNESNK